MIIKLDTIYPYKKDCARWKVVVPYEGVLKSKLYVGNGQTREIYAFRDGVHLFLAMNGRYHVFTDLDTLSPYITIYQYGRGDVALRFDFNVDSYNEISYITDWLNVQQEHKHAKEFGEYFEDECIEWEEE
jgi:hypothetical protein